MHPIAEQIWDMKYRLRGEDGTPVDLTVADTFARVAKALAEAETPETRADWATRFEAAMTGHRFLPAGRILAGAGTKRDVTLFNCFVMGTIPDTMAGIFENLKEAALTMQQGGGIGYDFSTLRPKGAPVMGVGADASGPLSFMDVWDAMCRTIMSAGSRRGAMMAVMRCDHPDIEDFIEAKREPGRLTMFNLSVLATDPFMAAVKADADWALTFGGRAFRTVKARALWDKIIAATYAYAEPGVIFIDRINARNNLHYCETIRATNPCGEQPLPPYGACLLGSINLAALVKEPFTGKAHIDETELDELVRVAVRAMDNVIDISRFPLEAQAHEAHAKRRIGLGVTGLADALIMCRSRYGSDASIALIRKWMQTLSRAAYLASVDIAKEKGPFPLYDRDSYMSGATIAALDEDVREEIAAHGIRNALVTSIAPTGTISLFAGNVSSGIEPVFAYGYTRKVLMPDGTRREERVTDYAVAKFHEMFGEAATLPDYFVNAQELAPADHLAVQAACQDYIDSSISKTINVPEDISFEAFKDVYMQAYEKGLKGCTTYRPSDVRGSVLSIDAEPKTEAQPALALNAPQKTAPYEKDGVVYMSKPLERETVLPGFTYKLQWPESDHAIYITINDIVQDGRRRPFEIFINSKNMEHYAWTVALTRMISAVFRRGGDVTFVVEELKAVFDPRGGSWMKGRYVPSLLAAIGEVIEQHMIDTGFITREDGPPDNGSHPRRRRRTHRTQHRRRQAQGLPALRRARHDPAGRLRDLHLLRLLEMQLRMILKKIAIVAALFASLGAASAFADELDCASTTFRIMGANDKVCVSGFDDEKVGGVTCYVSQARTGGMKGMVGVAEDPSRFSLSCNQTGPIAADLVEAEEARRGLFRAHLALLQEHACLSHRRCEAQNARLSGDQRQDRRRLALQRRVERARHVMAPLAVEWALTGPMRGFIHHLDLTVKDPRVSAPFYDAVLGHMGYRRWSEDENGIDWEHATSRDRLPTVGIFKARGDGASRRHDRYSPGLHHVAWIAESREDVDALYKLLLDIKATVLDPPADYPEYGKGYYAVMFADPDGLKLEYVYEPRQA